MNIHNEISDAMGLLSGMPDSIHFNPAALFLFGIYAVCLLAGLAIDIIIGIRLLAGRRGVDCAAGAAISSWPTWLRQAERLQNRSWTWREAALILIVLLAAQAAIRVALWMGGYGGWSPPSSIASAALWQGIGFHGVALAALAWSIRRRKISLQSAFGINWRGFGRQAGQGVIWYMAILPPFFIVSLIYQVILYYCGYPLSVQNVILVFMEPQALGVQVCLLVLALIVAPITEEALFRGMALPLLARTMGVIPAVVLTAVCFALMHFHLPALAPLFVLASGFAVAYIVSGSLWVPIIMHVLFNGMNLGLILLMTTR